MRPLIRPNVLQMHAYSPGKPISEVKRELGLDHVIKLASNENPLGASPKAVDAVREAAAELHLYPDGSAYELKQAICHKFGVHEDQVILGNGSDELIHFLGLVFLGSPEDEVMCGDPSFVRYDAAAHLAPAKLVKVPLDSDLKHDLPAMAKAVTENTRLIFIANPNNPTGTIVNREEVNRFLDDLPQHAVVVLDEAYYEFAEDDPDYPSSVDLIKGGRNVVGLRTFSKAYGLAGIRVGFGFAPFEIVDAVERAREPFNVNSLAQVAAVAALTDDAHVARTVEVTKRGMIRVRKVLEDAGAKVARSHANFLYADLGRPAQPVFQGLLEQGIVIRSGPAVGSPNGIRVTIGTDEEVDAFVAAFESLSVKQP